VEAVATGTRGLDRVCAPRRATPRRILYRLWRVSARNPACGGDARRRGCSRSQSEARRYQIGRGSLVADAGSCSVGRNARLGGPPLAIFKLIASSNLVGACSKGHRYSITSSARPRIESGIVRPIAFAVLRLRTMSNFVACSTGRSVGFAPLKILSTKYAPRRYIEERFSP
jgi:hypothetical protein